MTPAAPVLEVRERATGDRKCTGAGDWMLEVYGNTFVRIVVVEGRVLRGKFVGIGGLIMNDEVEMRNA